MARGTTSTRPPARRFETSTARRIGVRILVILWLSIAQALTAVADATAKADKRYSLDIPQAKAEQAIKTLSRQTGYPVIFQSADVTDIETNPLKGRYTLKQALTELFKGTALSAGLTRREVITISRDSDDNSGESDIMNSKKSILATVISFLVGAGGANNAAAQSDYEVARKSTARLEEVIVTAQKREQNAQDVPISISAFSEKKLEHLGIDNVSSLQEFVPGLVYGKNDGGQAQVSLRGISSGSFGVGFDPGVAIHIDGHYLQSTAFMTRDFYDVSRIEVLRGPQGTLYGKNVVGGTINIITNRPSDEVEGQVGLEVGNYAHRKIKGVLNLPISENLQSRFALVSEDRDGYTRNLTNGDDLNDSDYTAIRASLLYTPTNDIDIFISGYDYTNKGTSTKSLIYGYPDAPTLVNFLGGQIPNPWLAPGVGVNPAIENRRETRSAVKHKGDDSAQGVSIDIDWSLGNYLVRSLSSYNDSETFVLWDASNSDLVTLIVPYDLQYETFSQELQFSYDGGGRIKWITGLYYYEEDTRQDFGVGSSYDLLAAGQPTRLDILEAVETASLGVFAQLDHQINDRLELTYGVRYSRDEKNYNAGFSVGVWDGNPNYVFAEFGDNPNPQEGSWSEVTGRFAANYSITEDMMVFASIATGYKAGGFNGLGNDDFDPETLTAYEAGLKSLLWNNKLQVNLTGFYNDYQDKQEFQVLNNKGFIRNAAAATIYGLEAEIQSRPISQLELTAMVSYLHARYDKFTNAQDVTRSVIEDVSGNVLPRSPEWKVNFGAAYTWEIGRYGDLTARANFSWVDETYFMEFNTSRDLRPSYHRTDIRLIWENPSTGWSASAFVNNIEDDDVIENLSAFGEAYGQVHSAHLQPPRTYGVSLGYEF